MYGKLQIEAWLNNAHVMLQCVSCRHRCGSLHCLYTRHWYSAGTASTAVVTTAPENQVVLPSAPTAIFTSVQAGCPSLTYGGDASVEGSQLKLLCPAQGG